MARIAPSIISADFAALGDAVRTVVGAGAGMIHVDLMDGHFVPNLTLGPDAVRCLKPHSDVPLDVHMMVEPADRFIPLLTEWGADLISVHVEAIPHIHRTLSLIREHGAEPGVALNPGTPVEAVRELLPYVHYVVLMSVNPGFSGQPFVPTSPDKIRRMRALIDSLGLDVRIQVDGGVGRDNLVELAQAGADYLVAGSAIYGAEDPAATTAEFVRRLKEAGHGG